MIFKEIYTGIIILFTTRQHQVIFHKHYLSTNIHNFIPSIPLNAIATNSVYDIRLDKFKSGIGINHQRHILGNSFRSDKVNFNYAYHLTAARGKLFSIGAAVSLVRKSFDPDKYPIISVYQIDSLAVDYLVDFNFGVIYQAEQFLLGASVMQFVNASSSNFSLQRSIFITSSYAFDLNSYLTIKPGFLFRTEGFSQALDFNFLATFRRHYRIGFTLRSPGFLVGMIGLDIGQKFRLDYANSYHRSTLSNYSGHSHEFALSLMLN